MAGFEIRFKGAGEPRVLSDGGGYREGRVTIGETFWETFVAGTGFWSVGDYEASWTTNLLKLRMGQDAFFLTDVGQGDSDVLFRCWPAFHVGHQVFFTEKLLLRSNARGESGVGKIAALFEKYVLRRIPRAPFGIGNVEELIEFSALRRMVGSEVSFWTLPAAEFGVAAE